jgi:hypothetical protein
VVTRFTLVVPVTGDPSLFGMRTGIFSPELAAGPIAGEIDHPSRVLRLHCDNPADADHAKAYFEWALDPSGQQNAYVPEPAIDEGNYEAVLAVLRNARNALERSPSMSAKLDEEETRDLLLVILNAQFEGKAAGEVFNCTGKTDILIRDRDRNVFIGECKIFDPKNKQSVDHVVTTALDQFLGYLAFLPFLIAGKSA